MNINSPGIGGEDDSFDRGGVSTLFTIDGEVPAHTAILAICDTNVAIEGDSN